MNPNGIFKIGPEYFHAEKICGICLDNDRTGLCVFTDGSPSHIKIAPARQALTIAVRDWKAALKRCQPKLVMLRARIERTRK